MKFNVRDLAVSLSPQNQNPPPGCQPSCTPSPREECTGCGCTPTVACPCIEETQRCGSVASCGEDSCGITLAEVDDPEGRQSRGHQVSLGLLRQQLRSALSQPGAR